jgi:hypothetical protein
MPPITSGRGHIKGMAHPATLLPDVLAGQRPFVLDGLVTAMFLG